MVTVNLRISLVREHLSIGTLTFRLALISLKMDLKLLLGYSQHKSICHRNPNLQFHFGINLLEDGHGFIAWLQSTQESLWPEHLSIGSLTFSLALISLEMDLELLHGYSQLNYLFGQRASVNRNHDLQFGINLPEDGHGLIA